MRAAVTTRYGRPEVVEVREVPTPTPADNEVLVRVRASSVCFGDRILRSGPLLIRLLSGFRPRHPILGVDLAGTVEAVGPACDAVRARRCGVWRARRQVRRPCGVRVRGGGWVPRAKARDHDVRGSRHRVRGRGVLAVLPAQGEREAWRTGSRPWSVWQPRRVRRAAGEALRRARDRRVQQRQRRPRAIARGRRRDRLHGAGLHRWWTGPRRDRGRARQGRIPAQLARAEARWTLSARRLFRRDSGGLRGRW